MKTKAKIESRWSLPVEDADRRIRVRLRAENGVDRRTERCVRKAEAHEYEQYRVPVPVGLPYFTVKMP